MGWPWECGFGLGTVALALSGLALLTSLVFEYSKQKSLTLINTNFGIRNLQLSVGK